MQLIREAFEREAPENVRAFWRETVQPDPALEGDPPAAQVRGLDRHQQEAELVSD